MAHYELRLIKSEGNVNNGFVDNVEDGGCAIGEIYDSEGNRLGWHCSSTLDWLEHDLLRIVKFDSAKDTYSNNW